MKFLSYLNKTIEYSFYTLFLFVPLMFSSAPSELFELPKMFFTFGLTVLIGTAWASKMILQKQFKIQRTPLDIPIILFLLSQIVSTVFSIDQHVSLWGYYSRFNGGLLSLISYLFLYYALVSNFDVKKTLRLIYVILISGLIVALWGFPSHFGIDPTCFVFRGSFDTSCWTEAFKPTIRIFSTLGQPAWMAAFIAALIPVTTSLFLIKHKGLEKIKNSKYFILNTLYLIPVILFYLDLLYTNTRGGFIAFWIANIVFWAIIIARSKTTKQSIEKDRHPLLAMTIKYFLIVNLIFVLCNFLAGTPIESLNKFSLPKLTASSSKPATIQIGGIEGTNITDSGNIRLLVWRGAIDTWKAHPLIGTGVETFAFSYYKYKPAAHNLTSEWDYLYNKAHNEYLNYLATTGIFGLGSYMGIIGVFIYKILLGGYMANWFKKNHPTIQPSNHEPDSKPTNNTLIILGLFCGWISILVSNFFGFSVVIINILLFLIPGFVFILSGYLNPKKTFSFPSGSSVPSVSSKTFGLNLFQWILIGFLLLTSYFLLLNINSYWNADISYASGSNLDKAGSYQDALKPLQEAVNAKPQEPVYKDELSIDLATIAAALLLEKDPTQAAKFSTTAIRLSDQVTQSHPNNVVFWKNRVRLFYTLAQGDKSHEKSYLRSALTAIKMAQTLAPTDAKISYNLGILKGQIEGPKKGIEVLEDTVRLKPDYRDAYFALGLFYREVNENQKAITTYQYILKNIDPNDQEVQKSLKSWGK